MNYRLDHILKRNQLSVTESRKSILKLFLKSNGALAHADIERETGDQLDRVTVYRTLHSFLEKGIIHIIPTADNSTRYALCKNDCKEGDHHDNHVHFVCSECEQTICLEGVTVPEIVLPRGFRPTEMQVVVTGICKGCQ